MRNIVNIIYSAFCIVTFFIILFLLLLVYIGVSWRGDRSRTLAAYRANRVLSALWLKVCGYKLQIEGVEKIDPHKTYMFVGNHSNMLDLPITGYFLQHYYKSLAKKELKYVPIFGFLIRTSSVLVDRSSPASRAYSTQVIVDKLRQGVSFLIFPEGTRNKTGLPLKSFYSGAFKTAITAQVPVLPFVYLDHKRLQPVASFRFYPGTIRVQVFDAIETEGMQIEGSAELQTRVYDLMQHVILKEDKDFALVNGG